MTKQTITLLTTLFFTVGFAVWYTVNFTNPVVVNVDLFDRDPRPDPTYTFIKKCDQTECLHVSYAGGKFYVTFDFLKTRNCKALFPFSVVFVNTLTGDKFVTNVKSSGVVFKPGVHINLRISKKQWSVGHVPDDIVEGVYEMHYEMQHNCNTTFFGFPWRQNVTSVSRRKTLRVVNYETLH